MDDEIEALRTEKSLEGDAVADVALWCVKFLQMRRRRSRFQVVSPGSQRKRAHVVVQAVDRVALTVKVLDGFRANQAAGAGDENVFIRRSFLSCADLTAAMGRVTSRRRKPRWREGIGAAPGLHEPVTVIAMKAISSQEVRGIFERGEFPWPSRSCNSPELPRLPNALLSSG